MILKTALVDKAGLNKASALVHAFESRRLYFYLTDSVK